MVKSFLKLLTVICTATLLMFLGLAIEIFVYSGACAGILFFSDLLINTSIFTCNNALFGGIALFIFDLVSKRRRT